MGNYLASFLCKLSLFDIIKMKILKSLLIFVLRNKGRLGIRLLKSSDQFIFLKTFIYFICTCLHLSVYTHIYVLCVYRYPWRRDENIRHPRTVLQMAVCHHVGTENGTQVLSKTANAFNHRAISPDA